MAFNGLLNDAREAAQAQGIDYTRFNLDVVRHTGIAGLASGSANVGNRGLQLSASGWFLLIHEIGHNFGLHHANLWDTKGSDLPIGSPPLPSDSKEFGDPFSIPVHPNGALGQPTLTGPGQSLEYGDPWDFMGSGGDHFSMPNRTELGWVDEDTIARVTQSGTYRLYASETPRLINGRFYALLIPAREHGLWVELAPTNPLYPNAGAILRWTQTDRQVGTDLLQPSVAFVNDSFERTLPLAATFSDRFRNVHVTPIQAGGSGPERWMDVVVELSPSSSNRPPVVGLRADRLQVKPGEPVVFTAGVVDPDGDDLSWHWNFDDSTTALASNRVEKIWSEVGEYVVQLEVSDRKGGVGRSHVVARVGQPATAKIAGRVTDDSGTPIAGARVHGLAVEGKNRTLRWMITDSDGRYTLTQLGPGVYTNGAFAFGFKMDPASALEITGSEIRNQDYRGRALRRVDIESPRIISEGAGLTTVFTLTRTGPIDDPLEVPFQLSGTAEPGRHYVEPSVRSVFIPSGSRTATLALEILDVPGIESWKTIQLSVDIPVQSEHRRADGRVYHRFYPGLDWEGIGGQAFWTLTDPVFVPGASATATIADDDLRLEIGEDEPSRFTLRFRGEPGTSITIEESRDLVRWVHLSTQFLPRTGISEYKLAKPKTGHRFFRLVFPTQPPP
ncbi:MAG: PKD domain-containing protein [Verrucomicrobiales bacterium]|nr:PKD domain-containing protein [Verrucomicrobiales bacterium]